MTKDNDGFSKRLAEILRSDKMKEFNTQQFTLYEKQNENVVPIGSVEFSLSHFADEYDKQLKEVHSSIDAQITSIKSQLKHCKNPLQKLNMEREMNRLIREKGRR